MDFKRSDPLTYGLELELQIVHPDTGRLHPGCLAVMDELARRGADAHFAKEATLATIELNSSVHRQGASMAEEIRQLGAEACQAAQAAGLDLRGGGTHLAQFWNERVMAPTERAALLEKRFGFLPKRFSTYGMHVHVGMPDAESAIRVANVLQGLAPLFIALAAASPYLQLCDTGLASSRPLEPLVYPHGGPMPYLRSWQELLDELDALQATGVAFGLKDVYWDVRPKPEFGTVEVRVFDTPLRLEKALRLAGLTRALAGLALSGDLPLDAPVPTHAHRVSRFMACRDGLDTELFDPWSQRWRSARAWGGELLDRIDRHAPTSHGPEEMAGWRALLSEEPEHVHMRSSWQACAPEDPDPQALQTALATHHRAMSAMLLS